MLRMYFPSFFPPTDSESDPNRAPSCGKILNNQNQYQLSNKSQRLLADSQLVCVWPYLNALLILRQQRMMVISSWFCINCEFHFSIFVLHICTQLISTDPTVCVLPDCFCSEDGTTIPGGLPAKDVPMMITITFDDAINNNNIELYKEIFNGKRKNPNGCDIKATYFVSHKYTNYSAVQETNRKGKMVAHILFVFSICDCISLKCLCHLTNDRFSIRCRWKDGSSGIMMIQWWNNFHFGNNWFAWIRSFIFVSLHFI